MIRALTLATGIALCAHAGASLAQAEKNFPERPVRVIVAWAAGGNADVLSRIMGQKMSDMAGQQFVVENRGGANGTIGTEFVVRARPDGYTLLVDGMQTHAINAQVMKLPYVSLRDLTPIAQLGSVLHILVAHSSLPIKNTRDLVALAKARPTDIAYASFGEWTTTHLAGEFFQQATKTKLLHVTYKGGGPALTGILAGEVSLYFPGISIALPHIHTGKLRALGIASKVRSPDLPELATLAEQLKAPDYDVTTSFAIMAPQGVPAGIVDKLNKMVTAALTAEDVKKRMVGVGAMPPPAMSAAETLERMQAEAARLGAVIKTVRAGSK